MKSMRRVVAGPVVAVALATGALGVTTAVASPAQASCANNVYRVVWQYAGVYDQQSQNSYPIKTKEAGDRVTGPHGWGHVQGPDGHSWTKVWVHDSGHREGWMRDDAVTYVGCD